MWYIYTYSRLLFVHTKEGNSDTYCNIDELWRLYTSEINQSQKDSYQFQTMRYLEESNSYTESQMVAAGAGRREDGNLLTEYRVLILWDKKSFDDWLLNNVNVLNITEHLKMVK